VGHAVPTGDLNRRLSVWARVLDPARRRERQIAYLARHFESVHAPGQPPLRTEVADDRVFPGELRVVTFDLKPEDAGLPVAWGVSHERVETFLSEQDPRSAIIAGAVELAEGVLQPGQATSAAAPGSHERSEASARRLAPSGASGSTGRSEQASGCPSRLVDRERGVQGGAGRRWHSNAL
ncbi:MAG: hypothetical protein R3A51_17785, partial [Nannocystaceae bacterium]